MARTIPSDQNGFISPEVLRKFIRKIKDSQAPKTTILSLQNPTCEGRIYPPQVLRELVQIGKSQGLHVHLDGARIFHAALAHKIDVKQLVEQFDTVMFCLSKGLGSPIGSMVVGTNDIIEKIKVNRKRMGGILRKPGLIVQSCHISLNNVDNFIGKANQSAQLLAQQLGRLQWIEVLYKVDINMVFFKFVNPESNKNVHKIDLEQLKKFLLTQKIKCFLGSKYGDVNRFVTHHYVGEKEVHHVINSMKEFYNKCVTEEVKQE